MSTKQIWPFCSGTAASVEISVQQWILYKIKKITNNPEHRFYEIVMQQLSQRLLQMRCKADRHKILPAQSSASTTTLKTLYNITITFNLPLRVITYFFYLNWIEDVQPYQRIAEKYISTWHWLGRRSTNARYNFRSKSRKILKPYSFFAIYYVLSVCLVKPLQNTFLLFKHDYWKNIENTFT